MTTTCTTHSLLFVTEQSIVARIITIYHFVNIVQTKTKAVKDMMEKRISVIIAKPAYQKVNLFDKENLVLLLIRPSQSTSLPILFSKLSHRELKKFRQEAAWAENNNSVSNMLKSNICYMKSVYTAVLTKPPSTSRKQSIHEC